ncbi:FliI/YscN family ATPase [Thiohalorhabdus methylotrophus]|uniref:Flagellum-specific ATP synthase n=1 Tax=Thiohalorhabdus methylotrophus TaxID=3242694 RepID=A0ABV4TWK9_9GAMM
MTLPGPDWEGALDRARHTPLWRVDGRVSKVIGPIVESRGPQARVGELCRIRMPDQADVDAEVVAFHEDRLQLMPVGNPDGIGAGLAVSGTGRGPEVPVGEDLVGRVLDPRCKRPLPGESGGSGPSRTEPMDGLGMLGAGPTAPLYREVINPLDRTPIDEPLDLGVRSVNALFPVGRGQRMGIFAGAGVGKSTLLGMIARYTAADVIVIALVGERGREVREFLERDLGPEGRERSVLVIATSDMSPLLRMRAAFMATSIAEQYRAEGKHVLLMMDSLTRMAWAQREIGLAVGEPPIDKGYTPSVLNLLPRLLERAGRDSGPGSLTAIYTVLMEGDDFDDPVADAVRAILDGHLVLDRRLADKGHYPAIDPQASISRLASTLHSEEAAEHARKFMRAWAHIQEVEDLVQVGAYQEGQRPEVDRALANRDRLEGFLRQGVGQPATLEDAWAELAEVVAPL